VLFRSITLGMEVTITKSGASSDQTFTGIVTEVSLEATSSNGVAYFPTTITIESDGALSSGVYVTYSITAAQAEDAVLAPVAAVKQTTAGKCLFIQSDTEPENAVELDEGVVPDGFYAVRVETGLQSNNYVQITSGVDEGVTVYIQTVSTGSSVSGSDQTSQTSDTGQMMPGNFQGGMQSGMPGGMQGGFSGGGPMG
jgi:HlyD family secretion protein